MKIIALGDTHGRTDWKAITDKDNFDKVIFIGDYFDTHEDIPPQQQKDNFKNIIKYKKANMDKVILLFGNHDYHYIVDERYSGFQELYEIDIKELLLKALDEELLQMCCIFWNYIFVHAGITKTWCKANGIDMVENIEQSVNDLFKYKPNSFKFTSGDYRNPYGDEICQTPIWVRPGSLFMDRIDNYTQIVGHTTQEKIKITEGIILIDTLGTSGEYLEIIDRKVKSINK